MSIPDQPHPAERGPHTTSPAVSVVIVLAVLLAIAMVAAVVVLLATGREPTPQEKRAIGKRLPRLELQPLIGDAQPVTLPDLAGKVVLVNLWGTWCPPCRIEFPHIAALEQKFRDHPDFKLLAVSCSQGLPENVTWLRADTSAFLQQQGIETTIYADPDGVTRRAYDEVGGLEGFPTTFLLDRQGIIRNVWIGYYSGTERQMERMVQNLLDNQENTAEDAEKKLDDQ